MTLTHLHWTLNVKDGLHIGDSKNLVILPPLKTIYMS